MRKVIHLQSTNRKWAPIAFMLGFMLILGCGSTETANDDSGDASKQSSGNPMKNNQDEKIQSHSHDSPASGTAILDWADGLRLRFVLDGANKKLTIEVLQKDADQLNPIAATSMTVDVANKAKFDLSAVPHDGESNGQSSRFEGTHDSLAGFHHVSGVISAQVDGNEKSASFSFNAH